MNIVIVLLLLKFRVWLGQFVALVEGIHHEEESSCLSRLSCPSEAASERWGGRCQRRHILGQHGRLESAPLVRQLRVEPLQDICSVFEHRPAHSQHRDLSVVHVPDLYTTHVSVRVRFTNVALHGNVKVI